MKVMLKSEFIALIKKVFADGFVPYLTCQEGANSAFIWYEEDNGTVARVDVYGKAVPISKKVADSFTAWYAAEAHDKIEAATEAQQRRKAAAANAWVPANTVDTGTATISAPSVPASEVAEPLRAARAAATALETKLKAAMVALDSDDPRFDVLLDLVTMAKTAKGAVKAFVDQQVGE